MQCSHINCRGFHNNKDFTKNLKKHATYRDHLYLLESSGLQLSRTISSLKVADFKDIYTKSTTAYSRLPRSTPPVSGVICIVK
jgi:hypothetical protein